MKGQNPRSTHHEPAYRSGVAARLSGVPVETLRVWERRYGVVGPRLSPRGHRLYSADDVGRLALLKQLVDLGSPIGSIAGLTLESLHAMRAGAAAASRGISPGGAGPHRPVHLVLVGESLVERLGAAGALLPPLEVVASWPDPVDAAEALSGVRADVLAIEVPTLHPDAVAAVSACMQATGARHAVVAYRFGAAAVVRALRAGGHTVTRAPLEADALERAWRDAGAAPAPYPMPSTVPQPLDALPERRFDEPALARIARSLTTLACECPHHVVDLLQSLAGFERYSAECANQSPADAALHRYLQQVTGSARAMFEEALIRVARAEGLALSTERDAARTVAESG